jgi:putative DNA primase/helicase
MKAINENNRNKSISINPEFNDLNAPQTIVNHVEKLVTESTDEPTPQSEVFKQLIRQFNKVNFMGIANPQGDPEFKLGNKHYSVISIDEVIKLAEQNRWGLCKNHDFIYLYNGTYWATLEKEVFQKFLGFAAEKMSVPILTAKYHRFRKELFEQFLATAYLPTPESDKNTVLINLLNGTFEISPQGTRLRPFDRKDFITYQLPFKHDPQAKAPIFEKYLNTVLPDVERQRVLAEFLGFVFIKHGSNALKEEKALILYGTGANGKSVFFEIVNALLGTQNISSYSLQSLTNDNGYFRAKIANTLVNYASGINGKLESSIFKQLVSGEPVEARLPYGQPFILKQYAKLIFNCNELPKDVEHTNAYFRRFLIIPFDVTIPPHEQDKNLHTKIIESELSGVFNWVLDGLKRLLEQKRFSDCEAAKIAVEQYRIESDSVQMFLRENEYNVSNQHETLLKDVYSEYKSFCIENGFRACSNQTVADRLRSYGYNTHRKNIGTVVNASKKDVF